jgi:signal peptidase I
MIGAVIVALLTHGWLMQGLVVPLVVEGDSMGPGLLAGDRLLMNRAAWFLAGPHRGQIVVLHNPERPRELCVKRVVGLPGERIDRRRAAVLPKKETIGPSSGTSRRGEVCKLGPDEVFVVGDNLAYSRDSRNWDKPGVPLGLVLGTALRVSSAREPAGSRRD